jgi:hypothetical protein
VEPFSFFKKTNVFGNLLEEILGGNICYKDQDEMEGDQYTFYGDLMNGR